MYEKLIDINRSIIDNIIDPSRIANICNSFK